MEDNIISTQQGESLVTWLLAVSVSNDFSASSLQLNEGKRQIERVAIQIARRKSSKGQKSPDRNFWKQVLVIVAILALVVLGEQFHDQWLIAASISLFAQQIALNMRGKFTEPIE